MHLSVIRVIYDPSNPENREWVVNTHIPELAQRPDVVWLEWGDVSVREGDPRLEVSLYMGSDDMAAYLRSDDRRRYRAEAEAHGLVDGSYTPELNIAKISPGRGLGTMPPLEERADTPERRSFGAEDGLEGGRAF